MLDTAQIHEELRRIHPKFTYERDANSCVFFYAPLMNDPHVFIFVATGIDNKIKKAKFVEVFIYDKGQDVIFGRRYVIVFGEPRWQNKLKKIITFMATNKDEYVCEICGCYLVAKVNKFKEWFLGCSNFPTCLGTKEAIVIKY
jgi:hypothetical protein